MRRVSPDTFGKFDMPEGRSVSRHWVGQVLVLGTYPNQRKIEVTFVDHKNKQIRYKILTKN